MQVIYQVNNKSNDVDNRYHWFFYLHRLHEYDNGIDGLQESIIQINALMEIE